MSLRLLALDIEPRTVSLDHKHKHLAPIIPANAGIQASFANGHPLTRVCSGVRAVQYERLMI